MGATAAAAAFPPFSFFQAGSPRVAPLSSDAAFPPSGFSLEQPGKNSKNHVTRPSSDVVGRHGPAATAQRPTGRCSSPPLSSFFSQRPQFRRENTKYWRTNDTGYRGPAHFPPLSPPPPPSRCGGHNHRQAKRAVPAIRRSFPLGHCESQ